MEKHCFVCDTTYRGVWAKASLKKHLENKHKIKMIKRKVELPVAQCSRLTVTKRMEERPRGSATVSVVSSTPPLDSTIEELIVETGRFLASGEPSCSWTHLLKNLFPTSSDTLITAVENGLRRLQQETTAPTDNFLDAGENHNWPAAEDTFDAAAFERMLDEMESPGHDTSVAVGTSSLPPITPSTSSMLHLDFLPSDVGGTAADCSSTKEDATTVLEKSELLAFNCEEADDDDWMINYLPDL